MTSLCEGSEGINCFQPKKEASFVHWKDIRLSSPWAGMLAEPMWYLGSTVRPCSVQASRLQLLAERQLEFVKTLQIFQAGFNATSTVGQRLRLACLRAIEDEFAEIESIPA